MDRSEKQVLCITSLINEISQGENFDDALDRIHTELKRLVPCDRLALGFLHADQHTMVVGPVRGTGKILLGTGFRESLDEPALRQISKGAIVTINDLAGFVAKHPHSQSISLSISEGMKSTLTAPLNVNESLAGMLFLASRNRNAYRAEHEGFVRLIAGQLSIMLEKARLIGKAAASAEVKSRLLDENSRLRELVAQAPLLPELIGNSPPWRKTLQRIEMVAKTDATVLIRGETGTGKELIARAIHRLSSRKEQPFVAVNCGALSPQLIASELFGHEKGAFTGAIQRRLGRLDLAQNGTLFLDEVAELSTEMQVKLLRVLQEQEFERVGGNQTIKTNVRMVAATHRNLENDRSEGRFRDDLFFRLNVFPIAVPPLRERKEDIEPLLFHFLRRYSQKMNKSFEKIDPHALQQCLYYHWPGNIRELENLIERSVILSSGSSFHIDPLLEAQSLSIPSDSLILNSVIAAHLTKVLKITNGKIYGTDGAARLLGLKPSTLQAKLKKLGLNRKTGLN
jgi:formate hydrogenlyase transcriptional activator